MKILKVYKILIFIALALLLVSFFFSFGYFVSLSKQITIEKYFIVSLSVIVAVSIIIYTFFIKIYLQLIEKETIIAELVKNLNLRQDEKQKLQEEAASKVNYLDIAALVETLLPKTEKFSTSEKFGEFVLQNCSKVIEVVQGVLFLRTKDSNEFKPIAKYAFYSNQNPMPFIEGETIPGQVAKDKKIVKISDIPDDYFTVSSGLGKAKPSYIIYVPLVDNNITIAVIEIATFKDIESEQEHILKEYSDGLAKIFIKNKLQ